MWKHRHRFPIGKRRKDGAGSVRGEGGRGYQAAAQKGTQACLWREHMCGVAVYKRLLFLCCKSGQECCHQWMGGGGGGGVVVWKIAAGGRNTPSSSFILLTPPTKGLSSHFWGMLRVFGPKRKRQRVVVGGGGLRTPAPASDTKHRPIIIKIKKLRHTTQSQTTLCLACVGQTERSGWVGGGAVQRRMGNGGGCCNIGLVSPGLLRVACFLLCVGDGRKLSGVTVFGWRLRGGGGWWYFFARIKGERWRWWGGVRVGGGRRSRDDKKCTHQNDWGAYVCVCVWRKCVEEVANQQTKDQATICPCHTTGIAGFGLLKLC